MEEAFYKLASNVSSPLALAGLIVAIFSRIILALINAGLFKQTTSEHTAEIIKKIVTFFFVLSLVAAILGAVGWLYSKGAEEKRQTVAIQSFGHLVTTLRNSTEDLMMDYPERYKKLLSEGRAPNEAKNKIASDFRQNIDTTVVGDKLGATMRLGFPTYDWGFFLEMPRTTACSFSIPYILLK